MSDIRDRVRVPMTAYVRPTTKEGIRLVATLDGTTISDIVNDLCEEYLTNRPDVERILEGKESTE